ncbi:hypothetical protein LIER_30501 [Lithospermum erythrorhizon]|uniref:Integrase catalytic domain-containing protein n=1 Tax=Lithospermum erythrorhizon TaxID=34254 RepID=A0AAV3RQ33_LITER
MLKDCLEFAKRFQPCQFHANFIHQLPKPLYPTVASWPFDACGLDMVGPLPKTSSGHTYILAATDYFFKRGEVVPLKTGRQEEVALIYRYGVPRHIITDNGKSLSLDYGLI